MFILYALPVGLVAGFLAGGRVQGLTEVRFRWAPLALLGLLVQVVLFFGPVAESVGWIGMPIYIGSTVLVLVAVLRNARLPGLPIVAMGAMSNLAAIVANGGYMPASSQALAIAGGGINPGYSNSTVVDYPALAPLTDIFALPPSVPFNNVFSVGDVLIALGIAWAIAAMMRGASVNWPAATVESRLGHRLPQGRARQGATSSVAAGLLLGRLASVEAQDIWRDDLAMARWLADNLDLVAAATSTTLRNPQVLESERPVVLAERDGAASVVVCELGASTDEGFGCLVRHVAACRAETGLWVCGSPSEEHIATVSWLNQMFGTRFAMLNLNVLRIGDSIPAPQLDVVVRSSRADDPVASPGGSTNAASRARRVGDWLAPAFG